MGWLDRLTGRKKPAALDIPPGFDTLLDSACGYIMVCFVSGFIQGRSEAIDRIVKEKTAAGVDPAAAMDAAERMFEADPSYCQGEPMGSMAVVVQFAHQLGSYVERPSKEIVYIASVLFVMRCLNMPNFATSKEMPAAIARHDDAVKMLLDHCRIHAEAPATLKSEWNRLAIGIVVGNRMAQEFFAQLHAGTKPTPGHEISQLFNEHLMLRDRAMGGHDIHPMPPTGFVPDIHRWLTGDAPVPVTVAIAA